MDEEDVALVYAAGSGRADIVLVDLFEDDAAEEADPAPRESSTEHKIGRAAYWTT